MAENSGYDFVKCIDCLYTYYGDGSNCKRCRNSDRFITYKVLGNVSVSNKKLATIDGLRISSVIIDENYSTIKRYPKNLCPGIENVIFNEPATIVFWDDGAKTVVKAQEGEIFDPEKGLAMAITKKVLGNKYSYYNTILHWLKKYKPSSYNNDVLMGLLDSINIGGGK